jgi:O-acetyl-ADP-ribose deacetylase (regulator of RNase III)
LATFGLNKRLDLTIVQGTVVDFTTTNNNKAAIVNAANEGCLGGGGVDGAITSAGGENLARDRRALPEIMMIRCPTGSAVVTGPNVYGQLKVPYVIHAVGPCYYDFQTFDIPDQFLQSAYRSSLECCRQHEIERVAFSLLSAGVFRGRRNLRDVLTLTVHAIRDWANNHQNNQDTIDPNDDDDRIILEDEDAYDYALESITLCAFSEQESKLLLDVCIQELTMKHQEDRMIEEEEEVSVHDDAQDIMDQKNGCALESSATLCAVSETESKLSSQDVCHQQELTTSSEEQEEEE